ncbi:MAG TPA: pitrilysin family protein, partial [Thermoanaerobaculia bacterium]|nr:pitrilysin family protein [Thermoanaerobaculia bacterium]
AHMFEHMAFKGTTRIGTRDYPAEKPALEREAAAYDAWQAERLAPKPDAARLAQLEKDFRAAQEAADAFVVKNEFGQIIEQQGGTGLNANTSADATRYFYSLPANKVELFCYLESERFLHPVLRQFYRERDVVMEERRMRVDNNPPGRLIEQLVGTAFLAHPYGRPAVGFMSDLQSFTVEEAQAFFDRYYGPSNLTTVLVGDLDPKAVIPLLETYFGRIPARPSPPPVVTVEPAQGGEKTVVLQDRSQPIYIEAYHRPALTHPDNAVYDALDDILTNGRSSRLHRSLVRDQKIAVDVGSVSALPGPRYPHLWAAYAIAAQGAPHDKIEQAIHAELDRLKSEDVEPGELAKFKTRSRAQLLRQMESNAGLGLLLAEYQRLFGDWRELFRELGRIDAVQPADLRRVAAATFTAANRTVARIETTAPPATPGNGR